MKRDVFLFTLVLLLCGAGRAVADTTLVNLVDAPVQSNTPYTLNFVATSTSTTVSFLGYQVPSYEYTEDIMLASGGGPNLLGLTWTFIPAPFGSLAGQFNDGYNTGTNGLFMGGVNIGSYDTFTQTIPTTVGEPLTLSFLFSEDNPGPSGYQVTTSAAATPEPSVLLPLALGFGLAFVARKRRAARMSR